MEDAGMCDDQGIAVDCDREPGHAAAHYDKAKGIYWWRDPSPPTDVDWWRSAPDGPDGD